MGHSEDDTVHKIPHKMKTHWQNPLQNFGVGLIQNSSIELDIKR